MNELLNKCYSIKKKNCENRTSNQQTKTKNPVKVTKLVSQRATEMNRQFSKEET